jgi:hypothetical protein
VEGVEVKIKKLDAELLRYKDQMGKMKEGPGKVWIFRRLTFLECNQAKGHEDTQTEEDV